MVIKTLVPPRSLSLSLSLRQWLSPIASTYSRFVSSLTTMQTNWLSKAATNHSKLLVCKTNGPFVHLIAGGNFLRYLCSLFSNSANNSSNGSGILCNEKIPIPLPQYPLPVLPRSDLPMSLFPPPPPLLPPQPPVPPPPPSQPPKVIKDEEETSRTCSDSGICCSGDGSGSGVNSSSLDSRYQLAKRFLDSLLLQKAALQQIQKRDAE